MYGSPDYQTVGLLGPTLTTPRTVSDGRHLSTWRRQGQPRQGWAAIIPLVVGLAMIEGVSALNWIAVGDYFGRRSFASLVGIMTVFHSTGALIVPVVSGWIFDQTQSYALVLLIVSPVILVSGVAFAFARRPSPPVI